MTPFKLTIITPDRVVFDSEVEEIIFRTTEGEKAVLNKHEKYAASLVVGPIKLKINDSFKVAAISGGIVKVGKDKTTILANTLEWADEIDVDRAKKAQELANSKLGEFDKGQREFDIAEAKLKRAVNRINIASKM